MRKSPSGILHNPMHPDPEDLALLALTLIPGLGPTRIMGLVRHFGSAQAIHDASPQALRRVAGIGAKTIALLQQPPEWREVQDQLWRATQAQAQLVSCWSSNYPSLLREIDDPPLQLWTRGNLTQEAPRIAVVGTRRPTAQGQRFARAIAAKLAQRGIVVVSGLAYGIDAAAHLGALEAGGETIAVLGSGVDRIYPHAHRQLARAVRDQGALVSEYAMGASPEAGNFPRRNRIISGLCVGTLVVEAREEGGALITARLALEQNRDVFATPGSAYQQASRGTNRLIQRGEAKLVLDVEDILDEIGCEAAHAVAEPIALPEGPLRSLYEALGEGPVYLDQLCYRCNLEASEALVHLLELELVGKVQQLAGRRFVRV